MKKTLTINISSIIFHIDDDAYEMLNIYLEKVNARFSGNDEGKEVIFDIEARIAELFLERLKDKKQVVCISDVENVIERMGDPDEFVEDDNPEINEPEVKRNKHHGFKVGKRLYRDPDSRIIGGVSGGFGAYFGIDPVIVRILFIILAFLQVGFIAYLIFWVAVPLAKTTAQKLEMKGKRVNVSNIEQSISEEFNEVKDNFRKFRGSKHHDKTMELINPVLATIGTLLQVFVKFIIVLIGISFLVLGFAFILGFFGTFFFDSWTITPYDITWIDAPEFMTLVADIDNVRIFIIASIMLLGIPIIALIYGGFKMIFKFDANNRLIGFTGFIFWFIALLMLLSVSFIEARHFKSKTVVKESIDIIQFSSPVLYLKSAPDTLGDYYTDLDEILDIDEARLICVDDSYQLFIRPEIDIIMSNSNEIEIIEKRSSRSKTRKKARVYADAISYSISQSDSLFTLDPYFGVNKDGKYRAQELEITIKLPVGQHIFIDENLSEIIWNSSFTGSIWPGDLIGQEWKMTEDGLKEVW